MQAGLTGGAAGSSDGSDSERQDGSVSSGTL